MPIELNYAPPPTRMRWLLRKLVKILRRVTIALLTLLVVAFVGRVILGKVVQRRIDAQIAAAHARGEPVTPEDFVDPPIANQDNATFYIKTAEDSLRQTHEQQDACNEFNPDWYESAKPQTVALVRAYVRDNQSAAAELHASRQCSRAVCAPVIQKPDLLLTSVMGYLNRSRELANFCMRRATIAHIDGDDATAVESLGDALSEGDKLAYSPLLVPNFVAIGIEAMTSGQVMRLAFLLDIEGIPAPTTAPAHPASRQAVRALIADLLNCYPAQQNMQRCLYGESAFDISIWAGPSQLRMPQTIPPQSPKLIYKFADWCADPFNRDTLAFEIPYNSDLARASTQPTYPACTQASANPALPKPLMGLLQANYSIYNKALLVEYEVIAQRRVAAAALTLRLYQVDHDGKLPDTLNKLVPDYLPAVPGDPFAADGSPIGYRAAGKHPVLWVVYDHGDQLAAKLNPDQPVPYVRPYQNAVFDLRPPTTRPAGY